MLFLFKGVIQTYAFTDGYEFIWNSKVTDFLTVFIQQGRTVSGWMISLFYPHVHYISDLIYIRILNVVCLFLSTLLIYRMLIRNSIHALHALGIVILFICSPFASIVVHWEAASSCIWGYPVALFAAELIFTSLLNQGSMATKQFNFRIVAGTTLGVISLFIYQPDYTAFIVPAFIHFISGKERKIIWNS